VARLCDKWKQLFSFRRQLGTSFAFLGS
jgi:hypothetical protein